MSLFEKFHAAINGQLGSDDQPQPDLESTELDSWFYGPCPSTEQLEQEGE
jgi:hypothetical protein